MGTGETHSVEEFVQEAFSYVGLDWQKYVKIDPRYLRPTEVEILTADSSKATEKLGWKPRISFSALVKIMMDADMRKIGLTPVGEGDAIIQEQFPQRWWKVD